MIDADGFRPNVGIILCNEVQSVFWCKRSGQNAWQFPQGGIRSHETPQEAMFRELREETGLRAEHVEVIGATRGWLRYRLPRRMIRHHVKPCCIGQKQVWFMLKMIGSESDVNLSSSHRPEFDGWRWVDYWQPARDVVFFKRHVYERALQELAPLVFADGESPLRPVGHY
ncbi:MAG: RNA pyrophosphohydrolase [Pseudomonadota bacterium]|nr:RNA pyrophosphohydrolase [Pseudomonadota bacterium]